MQKVPPFWERKYPLSGLSFARSMIIPYPVIHGNPCLTGYILFYRIKYNRQAVLLRSSRLSLTFFVCFFVSTRQFLISTPFHISVSLPIFVPIKMGTKKGALTLVIAPFQLQSAHIHVPLVYISNLSFMTYQPTILVHLRNPIVNQYS